MSTSNQSLDSQGPTKTWRQPSAVRLWSQAVITFPKYLAATPEDYRYDRREVYQEALSIRQAEWKKAKLEKNKPSATTKPNSREFYDSKNARDKPDDGMHAKRDDESCLTCVKQGARCHGESVVDGKCRTCRGFNRHGQRTRGIRTCRWREPENGIFTYLDHQKAYSKGKGVEATGDNEDSKEDELEFADNIGIFSTVHDMVDPYAKEVISAMAATVFDGGWASSDTEANLKCLVTLAKQYSKLLGHERSQLGDVVEDIVQIFSCMLLLGDFVTYRRLTDLLPPSHPACTATG